MEEIIKMDKETKQLKKRANTLQVVIQIGKSGLTEGMLGEIRRQLRVRKTIKIKFLKNIVATGARNEIVNKIIEGTHAVLLTHTGSVITLHKD